LGIYFSHDNIGFGNYVFGMGNWPMTKVLELKGFKSLRALNAFHALLLGMKMLPDYINFSYESFFKIFEEKTDKEKETLIREAVLFVELDKEEVAAIACFCTDKNGVPYEKHNIDNLKPNELHEIIVAVCMEISKIKIDLVSEDEKKK
jgi:hypothetical protein